MEGLFKFGVLQIVGWILAFIALYIFKAMIRWKVFTKAGEAGWKSLIPIYGDFVEYQLMWNGKWFWINLGCSMAGSALMMIPILGPICFIATMVVSLLITTIFSLQEAKAFNQSIGFGIGLLVSSFVFQFLIAFDNNIKYAGPQPDPAVFNNAKESFKKEETIKPDMKFDPYTGEPINKNEQTTEQRVEEAFYNDAINNGNSQTDETKE